MRIDAFFATPSDQAAGVAGGVVLAVTVSLTLVQIDQALLVKRVWIRATEREEMNQNITSHADQWRKRQS